MADFNKKFSDLLGKIDDKVVQAKLNGALDMLKKGNVDDLAAKLNKMDKKELLDKINEMDDSKLKELNIDKNEIKKNVSSEDLDNLAKLLGEQGDEIVKKIKIILG